MPVLGYEDHCSWNLILSVEPTLYRQNGAYAICYAPSSDFLITDDLDEYEPEE